MADLDLPTRQGFAPDAGSPARLPDEWVARLAVVGTPQVARERLEALGRAGVTGSVLIPVGADPVAAL